MAKFHFALVAVFVLIAASDAFRLVGNEFNRLSVPAKNDESDSKFPDSLFTASFLPVKRVLDSKSAVPYTRVTPLSLNTESDSKSAIHTFRPINRRFPQKNHPLPVRRDVEVSYGNDMLIASNDKDVIGKPVPLSHIRRHNGGDAPTNKMLFNRRYNYDRFLVKKRLETIKKMRKQFMDQKDVKNQKSSGFMGSLRKFFDKYA